MSETKLKTIIKVYDLDRNKLDGVSVIYTDVRTNQVYSKTTKKGLVEVALKLDKEYLIVVSHKDYYTKSITINTELMRYANHTAFYSNIDVYLNENCEKDPAKSHIFDFPVGKIIYNNIRQSFEYDNSYTNAMMEAYNIIVAQRCHTIVTKSDDFDLFDHSRTIEYLSKKTVDTNHDVVKESAIDSFEEVPLKEDKIRPIVIDHSREFIYLQPRHSWPSELRNFILNNDYSPRPIGTFAYTEHEVVKDFYIHDVTEIRKKFPKEFDKAFPNWDYVFDTYSLYKEKEKQKK